MQEMLYPTSYLKSKDWQGLRAHHRRPLRRHLRSVDRALFSEAAEGGNIGLVEEGDTIEIDIPNRSIRVALSDEVLTERRLSMRARGDRAWKPANRHREVSQALRCMPR